MTLPAIISADEHGKLPADLKAHYIDREGKLVLDVKGVDGFELSNASTLMGTLNKERGLREAAEGKLKAFAELDPAAARDALKVVAEWKASPPEERAKKQVEATLAQYQADHAKALKEREDRVAKLQSQVESHVVDGRAREAIAKHKGNVDLLLPHVKARIRPEVDADGNVTAYVVDSNGQKAMAMQGASLVPMSFEQLVESMREQDAYMPAFAGSGASGSGGRGSSGNGNAGAFTISEEQARNDPRAYQAAKARAEKAGQPLAIV